MKRKLTIARGLLRLWIALAGLWAIAVPVWLVVEVEADRGRFLAFAETRAAQECDRKGNQPTPGACRDTEYRELVDRAGGGIRSFFPDAITRYGLFAVIAAIAGALAGPPLLILGLGAAILQVVRWIARGFMPPT